MTSPPELDVFAEKAPSDAQLRAILRRGRLKTRAIGCGVGLLSGGLGALMLALIGFELDPEVAHMPLFGKVVGVGFALLFCLVGLGMVGMAVLGKGGGSRELQRRFEKAPQTITAARRVVSTSRGIQDPGARNMLGSHMVAITSDDCKEVQVMMAPDDVSAVLRWVAARVPSATVQDG